MTSLEKLRDLNRQIEELQQSPDRDEAEIYRLEHEAAAIITARSEAQLKPIREGLEKSMAQIEELLKS